MSIKNISFKNREEEKEKISIKKYKKINFKLELNTFLI